MQIIIDIPESQYKTLNAKRQEDVVGIMDDRLLIDAIRKGVALPKGHGRLKDVDALEVSTGTIDDWEMEDFVYLERIENAPTIIEADKTGSEK